MADLFVGRGIAFPMRVNPTGGLALASGDDEIAESIRLILGTSPGERPMRPDFGCPIHDHVFAPADASIIGMIGFEVRTSLTMWEPRIDVLDVFATPGNAAADPEAAEVLLVEINYEVRATNSRFNLVYPFYLT